MLPPPARLHFCPLPFALCLLIFFFGSAALRIRLALGVFVAPTFSLYCQDILYTGCQDILYASGLVLRAGGPVPQPSIIFFDNSRQIGYSWWVRIGAGPAMPWAGRSDSRSMTFPSFHSREALAVIGTGRTQAELRARSFASPPGTRSKKGLMMLHLPSLYGPDCMATSSPPAALTLPKLITS